MEELAFRLATIEDMDMIYEWANEASVRANSFCSDIIPYEDHVRWYHRLLEDTITNIQLIFIDEANRNKPIGQCRLKVENGSAEIGYSIDASLRGMGFGKKLLVMLSRWIRENRDDISTIIARVKPENMSSASAFLAAGYRELVDTRDIQGSESVSCRTFIYNTDYIKGENTYIRPMTFEDTDTIVRWRNLEEISKRFFFREKFTRQMHENWMKTKVATGQVNQFMVCLLESDEPVGSTYLRDIDWEKKSAEYGVFIGEESARGHGIGKEILALTLEYAWGIGLTHICARAIADNAPSIYSFLHSGFSKDEMVTDVECSDGTRVDMVLMSIDKE